MHQPQLAELVSEIKRFLACNDHSSIQFHLENQPAPVVDAIKSSLSESEAAMITKIMEGVCRTLSESDSLQSKARKDDIDEKIKKELEPEPEEPSNLLEYLTKISQPDEKLQYEEEFGYPYFSLLKRVFILHGDNAPLTEAVKMMHSQLQLLYATILNAESIAKLTVEGHFQKSVNEYLKMLFPEEHTIYYNFRAVYKEIKKQIGKKAEEEDEEDEEPTICSRHFRLAEDEMDYFIRLKEHMTTQEFLRHSKMKNLNFYIFGWKKFAQLLTPEFLDEKETCGFLSFVSLKFIRKILLAIVRSKCLGSLNLINQPFSVRDITIFGNQLIDSSREIIKIWLTPKLSPLNQAQQIFKLQFYPFRYTEFVSPKLILEASKIGADPVEHVWNTLKEYRSLWTDRVQIEEAFFDTKKQRRALRRSSLYNQLLQRSKAKGREDCGSIWKQFILRTFGFSEAHRESPLGKKRKLDSLYN